MNDEALDRLEARCQAALASENNGKRFIPATEEEIRFLVYELSNIPALIVKMRQLRAIEQAARDYCAINGTERYNRLIAALNEATA